MNTPNRTLDFAALSAPTQNPSNSLLTPEMIAEIREARRQARSIARAAAIARFNGWTMAALAAFAALGVVVGSWSSGIAAIVLGTLGWIELRGGHRLRRYELSAPGLLVRNQLTLGVAALAYSLWSMYAAAAADPLAAYGGTTGDAQVDAMVSGMARTVSYGLYGTMAVLGVLIPGLTAWYYHSRGPKLRRFAEANPAWVVEALRAAA